MQKYRIYPMPVWFVMAFAILFLSAWFFQTAFLLNWDVSWCIHIAERLMAGGDYVNSFFDMNLPLTLFLYAPPVWLKKYFLLNYEWGARFYLFLLGFFSIGLSLYFIRQIFSDKDPLFGNIFALALIILLLMIPGTGLGQREHLFLLFTLPYLFALVMRWRQFEFTQRSAILLGCCGFVGFVIKPYFFVTFVLLELYYLFYSKKILSWVRLEVITIAILTFIYLLGIGIFYPNFFHTIVPLTTKYFYVGYSNESLSYILTREVIFYALAALIFFIIYYKKNSYKELNIIILISMLGALFSYLIQKTAWSYHYLPLLVFATLSLLLNTLILAKDIKKTASEYLFVGVLVVIVFSYPFVFIAHQYHLAVFF